MAQPRTFNLMKLELDPFAPGVIVVGGSLRIGHSHPTYMTVNATLAAEHAARLIREVEELVGADLGATPASTGKPPVAEDIPF